MSDYTHEARPLHRQEWEPTTEQGLAQMREVLGPNHFAANYAVRPLSGPPEPLPTVAALSEPSEPTALTEGGYPSDTDY